MLITGDVKVENGNTNTKVARCARLFTRCVTHINDEHVATAENLDIIMPMYNLIEYSANYSNTDGSLYQLQRDEQNMTNAWNPNNATSTHSSSFKYKSNLLEDSTADGDNRVFKSAQIVVPLKYQSNFLRSLEMPLIYCKIHLELNWTKDCVLSDIAGATTFRIRSTKLYVPIVTFSTEDSATLTKQLTEGFKRSVYWNEYKSKIESRNLDDQNPTRFYLDAFF